MSIHLPLHLGTITSSDHAVTSGVHSPTPALEGPSSSVFPSALTSQQQLDAARDVLATLPAPIVYSLRDQPGSPAEAVDRLFEVLRDGSFVPPDDPLGAPGSIIGATARAATLFESPAQLWAAMRTAIADPASLASELRSAPPASTTSAVPAPAAPPVVRTLEDAERLLEDVRSRPQPATAAPAATAAHSDWWEAALRFLLGGRFPA